MTSNRNDASHCCEFKSKIENRFSKLKYHFKWSIENFSNLAEKEIIRSPKFSPAPGLKLCAEMKCFFGCKYISLTSCTDSEKNASKQKARFISTISDKNGRQLFTEAIDLIFTLNDLGSSSIITLTNLLLKELLPVKDDTILISIYMQFYDLVIDTSGIALSQDKVDISKNVSKRDTSKILSQDILNMYLNSIGSDLVLRVGGKDLRANKAILRTRSSIFNKMFEHQLVEDTQNVVDIQDVSADIMHELLLFVYSGEEKDYNYNTAYELFYAADKYEMQDLRQICSENLLRQISPENVFDVLQLADRHQDDPLKAEVMKYAANNFKAVASSENWIKFAKVEPVLASEIVIKSSEILNK